MKNVVLNTRDKAPTNLGSINSNSTVRLKTGITLVEVLIVLGIIIIVTLAIVPSYAGFTARKDFNNKVETFVNEIANVRNKSLSGAVFIDTGGNAIDVNWGIRPICNGTTYQQGYRTGTTGNISVISTQTLPAGVRFHATECAQIVFNRLRGTPQAAGSITLTYQTLSRTITINDSGRIIYEESD